MDDASGPTAYLTVFMDYICPFCFIGALRLERLRREMRLRIHWQLLEIHPDIPASGRPVADIGYAPEQWRAMMTSLEAMAEEEGVDLARRERTANSHDALLLAESAKDDGAAAFYPLHRRLFRAYFVEGRDLGDRATLNELARQAGVPAATRERAWSDGSYEHRLQKNLATARKAGITGTPTILVGNRRLEGALPLDHLRAAAREAAG
ncbi:MAG TPA: DsbA family protein [Gammaproteobacteria bacterium]|nr:DsbA family protein [Gammaproteobacteria bacterium]